MRFLPSFRLKTSSGENRNNSGGSYKALSPVLFLLNPKHSKSPSGRAKTTKFAQNRTKKSKIIKNSSPPLDTLSGLSLQSQPIDSTLLVIEVNLVILPIKLHLSPERERVNILHLVPKRIDLPFLIAKHHKLQIMLFSIIQKANHLAVLIGEDVGQSPNHQGLRPKLLLLKDVAAPQVEGPPIEDHISINHMTSCDKVDPL